MDPSYSTNRRRTTLGLIDPSNNQTYIPTAIPALASAIKKPTQYSMQPPSTVQRMSMGGPRMSLGPSRSVRPNNNGGDVVMGGMGNSLPSQLQQASYPPPGTVQAQRMGDRLSQGNGGRQNGYGVTPARQMGYGMTPGQRRTSTYNARSFAQSGLAGKDPKCDKKQYCIHTLVSFLRNNGFGMDENMLKKPPSAKVFQEVFKFLYSKLDPDFDWQKKKFEEEVPFLMKAMRYPFADQIKPAQLCTVIAPHSWPPLLAMLVWMVELITCTDRIDSIDLEDEGQIAEDNPGHVEKLFNHYTRSCYGVFFHGSDDYTQMDAELAHHFDRKNEYMVQEIDRLSKENASMEQELAVLNSTKSPLIALESERKILLSDKEKFIQHNQHLDMKAQKLIELNAKISDELQIREAEFTKLIQEKTQLQAQVDAQEISPADVDRMTAEREQLAKNLETTQAKIDEIQRQFWEKEITCNKKRDIVEKAIQDYNALAYRIGLVPSTSPYAEGINFEIEFSPNATRPENMISVDLRNVVKPSLQKLRKEFNTQFHHAQDESIHLQEQLDALVEQVTEKTEELANMEGRIHKLTDQYAKEKEVIGQENSQNNREMEGLERGLQQTRMDGQTGLMQSQQKAQMVTIEYNTLLRNSNELKEQAGNEIIRILEDLINFKSHIENSLAEISRLAEQEYRNTISTSAGTVVGKEASQSGGQSAGGVEPMEM